MVEIEEQKIRYMQTLMAMARDEIMGRGPTPKAMIANLRAIADNLERMLPEGCDEEGRVWEVT